jgi:chromosome segregation ATPase
LVNSGRAIPGGEAIDEVRAQLSAVAEDMEAFLTRQLSEFSLLHLRILERHRAAALAEVQSLQNELQLERAAAHAAAETHREASLAWESERETLLAELESLRQQDAERQHQAEVLQLARRELTEVRAELELSRHGQLAAVTELQELRPQWEQARVALDEAQARLKSADAKIAELAAKAVALEEEARRAHSGGPTDTPDLEQLRQQLEAARALQQECQSALEQERAQVAVLTALCDQATAELENARTALETTRSEVLLLEPALQEARSQIEQLRERCEELQSERDRYQQEAHETRQRLFDARRSEDIDRTELAGDLKALRQAMELQTPRTPPSPVPAGALAAAARREEAAPPEPAQRSEARPSWPPRRGSSNPVIDAVRAQFQRLQANHEGDHQRGNGR